VVRNDKGQGEWPKDRIVASRNLNYNWAVGPVNDCGGKIRRVLPPQFVAPLHQSEVAGKLSMHLMQI